MIFSQMYLSTLSLSVLLILTEGQRLDQFNIFLSASERKVLIGHLDIDHLDGVFLTRRQGLAVQEEEYLRSLGYEPFGAESDSLLTRSDVPATTSTTQSPRERQQALPKDSLGAENTNFSLIIDLGPVNPIPTSSSEENTFIKVKPTLNLVTKQFTKLNLQFAKQEEAQFSKKSARVIQNLINKLGMEDQTKFLAQFTMLNFAQQEYAYQQFVSTPENVQQFALKQFLSLEPDILSISIDREIQAEEEERKNKEIIQTETTSFQNQISNTNFLNNQNNEFLKQNNNPVKQSRLIDQSRFQTNF